MYASTQRRPALDFNMLRWIARASAAVLFVIWLSMVLTEAVLRQFEAPSGVLYQAIALGIVFSGYAVGWRHELAGGLMAILGTIAFFIVNVITLGVAPGSEAAWFAAPGLLFFLAWYSEKHVPASY